MLLQTSSPKLREKALQDNASYDDLLKLGIAKEQSAKGAALFEKASGQVERHDPITEEVRRLQKENRQLKSLFPKQACTMCGNDRYEKSKKCPAFGQICSACSKPNHFAKVCRSATQQKGSNTQALKC